MSTRISSAALLMLAGCGEAPVDHDMLANAEAGQRTAAEDDGRILCTRGGAAMVRACTVDRERGEAGLILTVRSPDGGFRRLLVTRDGRGVIAADGAERARVRIVDGDAIEVALGDDRYRLPATVK